MPKIPLLKKIQPSYTIEVEQTHESCELNISFSNIPTLWRRAEQRWVASNGVKCFTQNTIAINAENLLYTPGVQNESNSVVRIAFHKKQLELTTRRARKYHTALKEWLEYMHKEHPITQTPS